jgi:hypothetical protein
MSAVDPRGSATGFLAHVIQAAREGRTPVNGPLTQVLGVSIAEGLLWLSDPKIWLSEQEAIELALSGLRKAIEDHLKRQRQQMQGPVK